MLTIDAIILVGGKGSRLQGIVRDRPKPLALVANRPFLEWLLLYLRRQGLRRVILATGYMGDLVADTIGDGVSLGLDLVYSQESSPLGTAGALHRALTHVTSDRVLVLNGDSFCPFDAQCLQREHRRTGASASLWLVPMDDCRRFGAVDCDNLGAVRVFREKSPSLAGGLINSGVYLFEYATVAAFEAQRPASLESDIFPALAGHGLYGVTGKGPFLDIGTPESYARASEFIYQNRAFFLDSANDDL